MTVLRVVPEDVAAPEPPFPGMDAQVVGDPDTLWGDDDDATLARVGVYDYFGYDSRLTFAVAPVVLPTDLLSVDVTVRATWASTGTPLTRARFFVNLYPTGALLGSPKGALGRTPVDTPYANSLYFDAPAGSPQTLDNGDGTYLARFVGGATTDAGLFESGFYGEVFTADERSGVLEQKLFFHIHELYFDLDLATPAPRRLATAHPTRRYPRDDGASLAPASRNYPSPRAGRTFGGTR